MLAARVARLAVAYVALAVGVALLINADLGVAPFDVLNTGLAETFHIRVGMAFLITSVAFIASGVLLGGATGWASAAGILVIGPLIEVALVVLPEPAMITGRLPMYLGGVLMLAAGISVIVSTELGALPGEVFMLGLIARGMPVAAARWATDGLALAVGAALSGAAGIGTLVFVVVFGPLVAAGLRVLRYEPPVLTAASPSACVTD